MGDLIGLEGGYETDVQLLVDLVGDLVTFMLELLDLLGIILQVPEIVGEIHKPVGRKHQDGR